MSLDGFLPLFLAQTPASPAVPPGPNGMSMVLFFGLMMGAMYFLMIAPERKKRKEHEKMLASLGSGDEVLTTGGIFGVITNVRDDRFVIRIADNTKIELGKGFIQSVVKKSQAA